MTSTSRVDAVDGFGGPDSWHPLWYAVGTAIAIMIGAAVGGSFVRERGRRLLPAALVGTAVLAAALAWSLDLVLTTFYGTAFH